MSTPGSGTVALGVAVLALVVALFALDKADRTHREFVWYVKRMGQIWRDAAKSFRSRRRNEDSPK